MQKDKRIFETERPKTKYIIKKLKAEDDKHKFKNQTAILRDWDKDWVKFTGRVKKLPSKLTVNLVKRDLEYLE